jgi:hypothetical protein
MLRRKRAEEGKMGGMGRPKPMPPRLDIAFIEKVMF